MLSSRQDHANYRLRAHPHCRTSWRAGRCGTAGVRDQPKINRTPPRASQPGSSFTEPVSCSTDLLHSACLHRLSSTSNHLVPQSVILPSSLHVRGTLVRNSYVKHVTFQGKESLPALRGRTGTYLHCSISIIKNSHLSPQQPLCRLSFHHATKTSLSPRRPHSSHSEIRSP